MGKSFPGDGDNTEAVFSLFVWTHSVWLYKSLGVPLATVLTFLLASQPEVISAKPEETSGGGWQGIEERHGMRKDDQRRFVIYLQSLRRNRKKSSKLISNSLFFPKRERDGLPSLKWHSHVLPASWLLSVESEGDVEIKKRVMCVLKRKLNHIPCMLGLAPHVTKEDWSVESECIENRILPKTVAAPFSKHLSAS